MVEVFAAGNEADGIDNPPTEPYPDKGWGSVASPGTAKNVITVGASESHRPLVGHHLRRSTTGRRTTRTTSAPFSSRGPTNDGRLKPDLVAPGTRMTGAAPQIGGGLYGRANVCPKFFPSGSTLYNLSPALHRRRPPCPELPH